MSGSSSWDNGATVAGETLPSLAWTPVLATLADKRGLSGSLCQAGGREGGALHLLCPHSVLWQVSYEHYLVLPGVRQRV